MKPRLSIILSFSLLATTGCAAISMPKAVNITWEKLPLHEIGNKCDMHSAYGCSVAKDGWCRVYTPTAEALRTIVETDPKFKAFKGTNANTDALEFVILGHEVRHCFEGKFHQ